MKKITDEKYNELLSEHSRLKSKLSPLILEIFKLNIAESVHLSKDEWTKKSPIAVYLGNYKKRFGMRFKVNSIGESGWLIKRIS